MHEGIGQHHGVETETQRRAMIVISGWWKRCVR